MTAVDLPERTAGPTSELSHPAELRIPLVIGVTGHRNVRPEHVPALKLRIA